MSVTAAPPPAKVDVVGYDGPTGIDEQIRMADFLAAAVATIPPVYRKRPADIFAVILQARALDIPIMTALHNLHWDEALGKGAMSAQLMGALLLRGGVVWETTLEPKKRCEMAFRRLDGRPGGTCEWDVLEAVSAGIAGSYTWQHYTGDMLYARCLARGARRFAPDLVLGLGHTLDELREMREHADTPLDNDRVVEPAVAEFLSQVGDDTPAARIQELAKLAASKKIGLADKYAGNGQTVEQRLHSLWLRAAAREVEVSTGAADAAMAHDALAVVPGDAVGSAAATAALDAPAGEGDADCGCPTARLVGGQGHDPAVCRKPVTTDR